MKSAALTLALLLVTTAFVQHGRRYPMVEVTYVSATCEMMGMMTVRWHHDWPPDDVGPRSYGDNVAFEVGPALLCGANVFVPTRSEESGRVGAVLLGFGESGLQFVDTAFAGRPQ